MTVTTGCIHAVVMPRKRDAGPQTAFCPRTGGIDAVIGKLRGPRGDFRGTVARMNVATVKVQTVNRGRAPLDRKG